MNIIQQATKDCPRNDCSIIEGMSTSTLLGWTPTYDKHGNRTDRGDPNITSSTLKCSTCGASWWISTQFGNTSIEQADKPKEQQS